ncbi:MAG: hypothetical protein ABIQ16_25225, partial [Polyangiaceae bacterium]
THVYLISIATAFCVSVAGCSGSNDPATPAGAGAPATAGAPAAAGAPVSAGAPSMSAGAGGAAETGGATAAAGAGGAPAAAGAGGAPATGMYTPLCSAVPVTAAGVAPTKAGACTATDTQLCFKSCGPQGVGFKSETCTADVYQEQSGCSFPDDADYSCFKIPTTQDATCPTTTITANTVCTTTACSACSDATGHYYDTSNNMKVGYCVCPAPGASGMSKWSCASDTAWPCPTGKGCSP